eukprot:605951-Pleurochrysis_carterae.AAC.1
MWACGLKTGRDCMRLHAEGEAVAHGSWVMGSPAKARREKSWKSARRRRPHLRKIASQQPASALSPRPSAAPLGSVHSVGATRRLVTAGALPPSRFFSLSQSWTRTHAKTFLPMRAMMNYSHVSLPEPLCPCIVVAKFLPYIVSRLIYRAIAAASAGRSEAWSRADAAHT